MKKEISALELTDQFIARIEALDGDLNAVPVRDFTRAREAAREADAALARGERQPLLGVPVTIKESYNVAGLPTTWGIPAAKGFVPQEDALAVARLKSAGVVILGKTNVPFSLADWQSYNDIHGVTNNPWDKTRTPGGSSGGSSAALAAGFGPLSLGSDIGGSLRVPAHFCGVCAHKPTYGIVAARGHLPPGLPALPVAVDLAVIGPMARSVDDLALALDIIAGPDEAAEGRGYRLNLPPARRDKLAEFRVLFIAEHPLLPTSPEVGASLERLAKQLAAAGVEVKRETRLLPDLAASARLYAKLLNAVLSARLPDEQHREMQAVAEAIPADDQSFMAELARGSVMSHREWLTGRFRASGPQTPMARLVSRLRRRHLPACRDARVPTRSVDAAGSADNRGRGQGLPLSLSIAMGRARDDLRTAGDRHSDRGYGRLAGRRPDHWPGVRRPDAARLRSPDRARVRRFHSPARIRMSATRGA